MPEEKKEKFTFSDKIKSSKAAGSKSFAKPASKIGRDGKPKPTLFERTRRDAPFFIAALVALLLLPFLYKYSGTANEEELTIPVNEENIFNPDHFGFDTAFTEDPDGQIAQLSGRDSLSLIRGFGGSDEENYGRDDMDFDSSSAVSAEDAYGAEGEGNYAAAHHESSDMDVEENTTNIYKRRAKRGTRAAFRRAATKIGNLSPATMRRGGGSGLGIKNWGGSMKQAAQKVKPTGPVEGPKPVSLQPLRARSGRSSFGGTGTAGRKSREALGKADARQALRDANVKPVDPTRVGGLNMFSTGGPGGGGKLERRINIGNGKEPWWWDMMKTRMQKEWEKNFERKWKWIDWADAIAMNILKGLINCLITGDDGGDMGTFFGSGGGAGGKAAKCCGVAESGWKTELAEIGASALSESTCKTILKKKYGEAKYKEACGDDFWEKGVSAGGARVGFFGQRLKCLGFAASAYGSGELGLNSAGGMDCATMPVYRVVPSGEALKWNIYTYVVVRNYFPDVLKNKFPALQTKSGGQNLLCASMDREHGGSSLNHSDITGGVGHVKAVKDAAKESIIAQTKATDNVPQEQQEIRERSLEINQEGLADACVVVVSRGNVLAYEAVKNKIMDLFKELGNGKVSEREAEQAFYQLDLLFVGSVAMKDKLAYAQWFESGHRLKDLLPLPYWEFENAYILHKKITHKKDGSRDNVYKKNRWRMKGVDMLTGPICYYDNLQIECGPENTPTANLVFNKTSFKGGSGEKPSIDDVTVSATFKYLNSEKNPVTQPMINPTPVGDGYTFKYTMERIYGSDTVTSTSEAITADKLKGLVGKIEWKAQRGDKQIVTATCTLNLSGDLTTPPIEERECKNAQQSEKCCLEINGADYMWDASKPVGSQCVKKPVDECPQGAETNAKCCKDTMGPGYLFDPNHTPKCYKPETVQQTRLAPVISWVPTTGKTACREDASNDTNPTESTFAKCTAKIPGVVKDNTQKCGSQQPMMMDSNAAAKFVKDVVAAYNKNLPAGEKPLSDKFANGKFPTDGEFIDALYLAKGLGIQKVPASAVCELGRDMVRMSRDKHTKEKKVSKPLPTPYASEQWKDSNTVFHNELGAFLAYIHVESLFYPQKYYGSSEQCDYRFQVLGEGCPAASMVNWANESCLYSGKEKCKEYHHNNYNNIPSAGAQAVSRYPQSLAPIQSKGAYLLRGLASGSYPSVGNSDGSKKGKQYIERISPLLRESSGFTAWQGQACVAGAGNTADLQVEDVLNYVETVCSVGLDFKPYGTPGSQNGSKQAPGQSGSDTGTQGN